MQALAAVLTIAAPLIVAEEAPSLVADEKSLFHIPSEEDFRLQRIARTDHEKEWPFSVDEGYLACTYVVGKPAVYFTEMPGEEDFDRADLRTVIVSTNPFDLAFGNLGGRGLIRKNGSIAELIRLMAPFESLGSRLCDQPRGTNVGPGEL